MNCRYYSPSACVSLLVLLAVVRSAIVFAQTIEPTTNSQSTVSYETVQPVFRKHCVSCHNDDQPRGGLSLVSLDKIAAGANSGNVLTPGKPEESSLFLVTAHLDNPKMPPNKPRISQRELDLLEKWIKTGLVEEWKVMADESEDSNRVPTMSSQVADDSRIAQKVGIVEATPLPQPSPIHALAVHPNTPLIAIPGVGQILLLDPLSKQTTRGIPLPNQTVSALQYSRQGDVLLVATGVPAEWGHVARWDVSNEKWLEPIGKESDTPICLSISDDGKRIAVGTTSKVVNVYSVETNTKLYSFEKHTDWITSLRWSPDGLLLASGDRFGAIQIWDATSGNAFATLRGHTGPVVGLLWSSDGNQLVSGGGDGLHFQWDLHTQQASTSWLAHNKGMLGLASFDGSGTIANQGSWLSFGRDGKLAKWTLPETIPGNSHEVEPNSVFQLPDEITTVTLVPTVDTPIQSLLAPNTSLFVVVDASGAMRLVSWDQSKSQLSGWKNVSVPIEPKVLPFAIRKPTPPVRLASIKESHPPSSDRLMKSPTDSVDPNAIPKSPVSTSDAISQKSLQDDLLDSKRALESVEQSKQRTIETLAQLEETAARLKQLIAIQEARLKQQEWKQAKEMERP